MSKKTQLMLAKILQYIAVLCVPNLFLFYLYNNNRASNHLVFGHIVLLGIALAFIAVGLFVILKRVTKSEEIAFLTCFVTWVLFWMFGAIGSVLSFLPGWILGALLIIIIVAATFCLFYAKINFKKIKSGFVAFSAVLVMLTAFGILQEPVRVFSANASLADMTNAQGDSPEFYIKRDFYIDPSLPQPDIYWLHLDGMISFDTFEHFWGHNLSQVVLPELERRGFVIDEHAFLRNAIDTPIGMTMMLSPSFYDSYLGIILENIPKTVRAYVNDRLEGILTAQGVRMNEDVFPYFEFFAAFLEAGYTIQGVNEWWNVLDIARITGYYEEMSGINRLMHNFRRSDLPSLLALTTPLSFLANIDYSREQIVNMPRQNEDAPRLVWKDFYQTHGMFWYLQDPGYRGNHMMRLDLYVNAFVDIINEMLASIDEILERNPYAVIVLQSDHGLHTHYAQLAMINMGLEHDEIVELAYSVFSAVRIPQRYGSVQEPIAPINIARELVNRFVGQNYEMAAPHLAPHLMN